MEKRGHTRKAIRFPLEIPITFWWTEREIEKRGEGQTRDVSQTGAFVFAGACPPLETQIGFKFLLPGLPGCQPPTEIEAEGKVLRVEPANKRERRDGFAILTRHMLLRANSNASRVQQAGKLQGIAAESNSFA